MQVLAFFLIVFCGVLLAVLGERLGRRFSRRPGKLREFYARLGKIAPGDPCPCARAKASGRIYQECCRPNDVKSLEDEAKRFVWTDWMRRSGGRRRTCSMESRLKDFPIPEACLPKWVTHPAEYAFPISEEEIRTWTPLADDVGSAERALGGPDLGGGLPL